ncbi:MAG: hypothetical protein KY469_19640 [Actinobacteria bacterium]|nr:hypothetical protein [Actinomycetota bacterium]
MHIGPGRTVVIGLLAAILATTLIATTHVPDGFHFEQDETQFFLRRDGCGSTAEPGRLNTFSGPDGADGCGTIGGVPLREVNYQLGSPDWVDYTTANGVPLYLDADRDIEGVIRAESWTGLVGGVGQTAADVQMMLFDSGGTFLHQFPVQNLTAIVTPDQDGYDLPFSYDVPADFDEAHVGSVVLSVAMHGANWNQHNLGLEGDSHVTMPTLILVPDEPAE